MMALNETSQKRPLNVLFLHPDLVIGGAERLVVDAAVGLQEAGHQVTIYTNHHDPSHCFEETRDGTLSVQVYGDFLPRTIFGKFNVACVTLRGIYLALAVIFLGRLQQADVVFCDQLSAWIPILKYAGARVFFYCHFPDLLLAERRGSLKRLYRLLMDWFERRTIVMADQIVVNSRFTASMFARAFDTDIKPEVLYPSIRPAAYDRPIDPNEPTLAPLKTDRVSIVSINRFERKKNIELAIRCFAQLRDTYLQADDFARLRLVIAGGYNKNVQENVEYLEELDKLAQDTFGLHTYIAWDHTAPSPAEAQVIFLPSFDNAQRGYLLATSRCLLYTPSGEHFGIVPIEAMYARLPVVAVADGGPTETIIDHETGYLCPAEPAAFAQAVYRILIGSSDQHAGIDSAAALERKSHMGQRGRDWVLEKFTLEAFVRQLDDMLSKLAIQPKSTPPIPLWPLLCLSILITFILPIWFLI